MRNSAGLKWILMIVLSAFAHSILSGSENATYRLIVFEGSDWCVNCIRLEKNILSDSAFINFANKAEITIERIDFPQRKKIDKDTQIYNQQIADKYSFTGDFPTLILIGNDPSDPVIIKYLDQNTEDFIKLIKEKITLLN